MSNQAEIAAQLKSDFEYLQQPNRQLLEKVEITPDSLSTPNKPETLIQYTEFIQKSVQTIADFSQRSDWLLPEIQGGLNEAQRREIFAVSIAEAQNFVVTLLENLGYGSIEFITPIGIPNAGKSANIGSAQQVGQLLSLNPDNEFVRKLSLSNPELAKVVTSFGSADDIKTGTGGLFVKAEGEESVYETLFKPYRNMLDAKNANFIDDNITSLSVLYMIAYRLIQNGEVSTTTKDRIKSFILDIYPRSSGQENDLESLGKLLESKKIGFNHTVYDLKLMSENDLEFLLKDINKKRSLEIVETIKNRFNEKVGDMAKKEVLISQLSSKRLIMIGEEGFETQEESRFAELKSELSTLYGFKDYEDFLLYAKQSDNNNLESFADTEQKLMVIMFREVDESIKRAQARYFKDGRVDDSPENIVKRVYDYITKTYKLSIDGNTCDTNVTHIPTYGHPAQAAKWAFERMFLNDEKVDINEQNPLTDLLKVFELRAMQTTGFDNVRDLPKMGLAKFELIGNDITGLLFNTPYAFHNAFIPDVTLFQNITPYYSEWFGRKGDNEYLGKFITLFFNDLALNMQASVPEMSPNAYYLACQEINKAV